MSANRRYNPAQTHNGVRNALSFRNNPSDRKIATSAISNVNMPTSAKYTPNTSASLPYTTVFATLLYVVMDML